MMNGIEKISETILADAKKRADSILAEAEASASSIRKDAKARIERDTASALSASKLRVADIEEKSRLASGLERKKMLQTERQNLIGEAFDKALDALVNLPDERYRALLVKLAKDALSDGLGGELLLNKRDLPKHGEAVHKAVQSEVGAEVTLSADTAPIVGGLVIRRGKIELNCALDVIVRMLSEQAAFEVSNALFGKGE
jgi:V/A-type H+-transporting ATPase subunit E